MFLATGLPIGAIGGLIGWISHVDETPGPYFRLMPGLTCGLMVGLFFGLLAGLNRGGSAWIKHYALRLILCLNGHTPFNFIGLLDKCAKLIFLKKVGGGYIFVHRMLLEYFADIPNQDISVKR